MEEGRKKNSLFSSFKKTLLFEKTSGARRASWRIVSSIEQKEEAKNNEAHVARIKTYRAVVRVWIFYFLFLFLFSF